MKRSIAIDASSTALGWVMVANGQVVFKGSYPLAGSIQARCLAAQVKTQALLDSWSGTEYIAIESPVARFPGAVIPQARVSGAILAVAEENGVPVIERTPKQGKKALAGNGNADKEQMVKAAAPHFGYDLSELTVRRVKGKWKAIGPSGDVVYDEDAADAVGIYLASQEPI